MQIKITMGGKIFKAQLNSSPTAKVIFENLPLQSTVNVWGNEIYFGTQIATELEPNAKTILEIGDLAFYPPMKAFCIFFGSTPASNSNKPEAAGPVNVFGSIIKPNI